MSLTMDDLRDLDDIFKRICWIRHVAKNDPDKLDGLLDESEALVRGIMERPPSDYQRLYYELLAAKGETSVVD